MISPCVSLVASIAKRLTDSPLHIMPVLHVN